MSIAVDHLIAGLVDLSSRDYIQRKKNSGHSSFSKLFESRKKARQNVF